MDAHTCTPISDEVAEHIVDLLDVVVLNSDTDVVFVRLPRTMDTDYIMPVLRQLVGLFSEETTMVVASKDMDIEELDEADMAERGWVRAPGC